MSKDREDAAEREKSSTSESERLPWRFAAQGIGARTTSERRMPSGTRERWASESVFT